MAGSKVSGLEFSVPTQADGFIIVIWGGYFLNLLKMDLFGFGLMSITGYGPERIYSRLPIVGMIRTGYTSTYDLTDHFTPLITLPNRTNNLPIP